jgi:hypothetical protein
MKMHMNACRGGAWVRAVILCLLAILCLSLVALPVKASPPTEGRQLTRVQRNVDEDPWAELNCKPRAVINESYQPLLVIPNLLTKLYRLTSFTDSKTNQPPASTSETQKVSDYGSDGLKYTR